MMVMRFTMIYWRYEPVCDSSIKDTSSLVKQN